MEITIKYIEPKILSLLQFRNDANQLVSVELKLDWGYMGTGLHAVYKQNGKWMWTDDEAPIPNRAYDSLEYLMYNHHLPQGLKSVLSELS